MRAAAMQKKKKKVIFLVFHGFSRKSIEDEFSRQWNGGWIFLGIKRGLQKIKNNNNMIRLVPARTESGRRK